MAQGKLESIQALRALAAISTIVVHALATGSRYTTSTSHFIGSSKYLASGVDLFFVISGFVIYFTTTRSNLSAQEFLSRRLQRIVPPYWLLTTLYFGCLLAAPGLSAAATAGWSKFIASLGFVAFATGSMPVIYPGWTLEYEMCFYALTAAALVMARNRPWAFVSVVLCGAVLIRPWVGATPSPTLDFLTSSISLSFLAGILVGQWTLKGRPGVIEAIAFALAIASTAMGETSQRALYAGLPSALLVYGAVKTSPTRSYAWLAKLGDASYAIYLLQVFPIAIVGKISQALMPSLNADVLALVMTFVAVLAGCAFHQWVERPMGRLWSSAFPRTTRSAPDTARPAG
jgi:exopolysaccharide production protein ExoZ